MILVIDDLIGADLLAAIRPVIADATFVDGRRTAGPYAAPAKRNLQIDLADGRYRGIYQSLMEAMFRHPRFVRAVRPRRFAAIRIGRYDQGMEYGTHFDDPMMGAVRTDVSFTVFLGDPASYDGGELIIETTIGERAFKLAAGAAVVYPAGALHRVSPVTRGSRLVAAGWVQSLVRDPGKREVLYDLDNAAQSLFERSGASLEFTAISKSAANLMRMWAEL